MLVGLSFNASGMSTVWSGFSVKWYAALLANRDILDASLNTLVVGLISTLIGVFVTVGFIAYTVWGQVTRPALDQAKLAFEAGYARAAATAPLKG